MADRHLTKLPEKSFVVAPGDVVGGLIYIMDKPLGVEEGMVGISIDSEPYRAFVSEMIDLMEYKLKRPEQQDKSSGIYQKSKMLPNDHPIFKAYQRFTHEKAHVFLGQDENGHSIIPAGTSPEDKRAIIRNNIIDGMLNDKAHLKKRHPLKAKDIKSFFSFRKLHEIEAFQAYYKNTGLGGLLFQHYMDVSGIRNNQNFSKQIGRLIELGNKAYMVKQDGEMQLGGTSPGAKKILKTGTGKTWLQPLLHPAVIVATAGLSIPLFGIGMGIFRGFHIVRNRPVSANSNAIVEALSTKMAGVRGFSAQEIDTIEGTYLGDVPKIATIVTWADKCDDLTGKLAGGGTTWDSVVVMWDKKHELPIKINDAGDLIEVKEVDENKLPISYQKIKADGSIIDATQEEYNSAMMMSEDKIQGLGESLLSFISMGDRDGIGAMGQNKAIVPLSSPNGQYLYQFYGIDFGKAYNGVNPIVESLRDDFTFDNPTGAQSKFRNISILYDNPLRDKMKGLYLLSALRGQLTGEEKDRIAQEYEDGGDKTFAKKLREYPASVGGVNADIHLIDSEISKYNELLRTNPRTKKDKHEHYVRFIQQLENVKRLAQSSDNTILEAFSRRKNLTPKQIDLLDNIEKLSAKNAHTISPDGTTRLNHIRVERADRVPWQITPGENGQFILTCEAPSADMQKIKQRLLKINDPKLKELFASMENVNGKLSLNVTPQTFERLQQRLTEKKVAASRDLKYRTPEERSRVFKLVTAERTKLKVNVAKPHTVTKPHATTKPVVENVSTRQPHVGFAFKQKSHSSTRTDTTFEQSHTNVQALDNFLTTENRRKHHIVDVIPKNEGTPSLEIVFKKPGTTIQPKAFAENGTTQDSVNFSTTKGLPTEDFAFVAKEISTIAVSMANPGAEFDLSGAPIDKQHVLEAAFKVAIAEAVRQNRFTEETKPTIIMGPAPSTRPALDVGQTA